MDTLDKRTNELIRKAFSLWGIDEVTSSELDPLVKLLLAATAGESLRLEKLINDMAHAIGDIFTDKLLPYSVCGPQPAFGLASAKPVESTLTILPSMIFEANKVISGSKNEIALSFRPLTSGKLFDAQIRAVFGVSKLIRFPEETAYRPNKKLSAGNSIWFGIKLNDAINNLDELSIYVDIPETLCSGSKTQVEILHFVELFSNNKRVSFVKSMSANALLKRFAESDEFKTTQMINYLDLVVDAAACISDRYLVISDKRSLRNNYIMEKLPDTLKDVFDDEIVSEFKDELLWLELRFSRNLPVLDDIKIIINAFPVINLDTLSVELSAEEPVKKVNVMSHQKYLGVIDYKLFDEFHSQIDPSEYSDPPFVIRQTETESYSPNDLYALISELLYRYSTEKQAFGDLYALSADDIRCLNNVFVKLHEGYLRHKVTGQDATIYAILSDSKKQFDTIELICALTNGEQGNSIEAGEKLKANTAMIDPGSLCFISKTINGRNRISGDEKRRATSYFFTTHDKIVSNQDIITFCYKEIGDDILDIVINSGAIDGGEGLRKAIFVNITLCKEKYKMEELVFLQKRLEYKLNLKSALVLPVRFILSE